jgi:hypothetical protein
LIPPARSFCLKRHHQYRRIHTNTATFAFRSDSSFSPYSSSETNTATFIFRSDGLRYRSPPTRRRRTYCYLRLSEGPSSCPSASELWVPLALPLAPHSAPPRHPLPRETQLTGWRLHPAAHRYWPVVTTVRCPEMARYRSVFMVTSCLHSQGQQTEQ